ncbi:MAG: hypothetical protein V1708_01490 [Candidatus Micrarchaeota archaeon]
MRFAVAAVTMLLLAFSPAVFSVSSEQAKAVAEAYLFSGEAAVVGQFNPIEYGSDRYWLVYITPQDSPTTKNLVIAVKEEGDGATLETRQGALEEVLGVDFGIGQLQYIQDGKFSYDDLEKTVSAVKAKISGNSRPGLDRIEAQQPNYPDLSFEEISSLLRDLEDTADRASQVIADGRSYQTSFAQSFYASDLQVALDSYPAAFDEMDALVRAAGLYQKAVDSMQKEIPKKGLSLDVGNSLIKSLDSVRDVGIDKSFESFIAPRRRDFEGRLAKKAAAVNNSISGLYFLKAKVEALKSYADLTAKTYSPEVLLSAYKTELASCGIATAELSRKWLSIKQVMGSPSANTEQFSRIPLNASQTGALADSIYTRLENCINAPVTVTPTPVSKQTDFTPYFLVVLLAVIGYAAYRFLQGRQAAQDQEE